MAKKIIKRCSNCRFLIKRNYCIVKNITKKDLTKSCIYHEFEKSINIDIEVKKLIIQLLNDFKSIENKIESIIKKINGLSKDN